MKALPDEEASPVVVLLSRLSREAQWAIEIAQWPWREARKGLRSVAFVAGFVFLGAQC